MDVEEKLRVLDAEGKSIYKSKVNFGAAADAFEYGELNRLEGRYPTLSLRRPPRGVAGSKGEPLVVVTETRKGALEKLVGVIESSRVVILQWDGGGFTERAASPKSDFFYSGLDLLSTEGMRRGGTGYRLRDRAARVGLQGQGEPAGAAAGWNRTREWNPAPLNFLDTTGLRVIFSSKKNKVSKTAPRGRALYVDIQGIGTISSRREGVVAGRWWSFDVDRWAAFLEGKTGSLNFSRRETCGKAF